jgi:hypothetical protein
MKAEYKFELSIFDKHPIIRNEGSPSTIHHTNQNRYGKK